MPYMFERATAFYQDISSDLGHRPQAVELLNATNFAPARLPAAALHLLCVILCNLLCAGSTGRTGRDAMAGESHGDEARTGWPAGPACGGPK